MTSRAPRATFQVERIGPHAARFLHTRAEAKIVAVFERCFYIEAGGAFCCIGMESIGNGPLNAIFAHNSDANVFACIEAGTTLTIVDGRAHAPQLEIDTSAARLWLPPEWPHHSNRTALRSTLTCIRTIICRDAPRQGLSRLAVAPAANIDASDPLHRIGAAHLARLAAWLDAPVQDAPVDLLGLGPGLTPSGDDVLCGALIALHAVGQSATAAKLADAVRVATGDRTSPLSAAFLDAAADGMGSEALHTLIAAVLSGDSDAISDLASILGRIGHTSGWDAMAGAVLALKAVADEPRLEQSTRSP